MSADQPKPRFEPPPWEREAFDRFQRAREESRAREELDEAIKAVRETPKPVIPQDESLVVALVPEEKPAESPPAQATVPEDRIQAMLIELRGEETPPARPNMTLINSVSGVMVIGGVYIVVQAAVLFADSRAASQSAALLAATISFVVLLTGLGFIAGAVLLFRKYHQ